MRAPPHRPGKSGKSRARLGPIGPRRRSPIMPRGGRRGSPGSGRSTRRSPRPPMSNCFTTAPMPTMAGCASPGRSRSRACRRIASPRATKPNWPTISTPPREDAGAPATPQVDFSQIVIDYLKTAGIHQSDKSGKIDFDSVTPWPGHWVGAEGRFHERDEMRRAAILIGPEYRHGLATRSDRRRARGQRGRV